MCETYIQALVPYKRQRLAINKILFLAFFSFDYEWVNYGKANFDFGEYKDFEQGVNDEISNVYGSAHIFRVGLELAIKVFRLRGGFAHYGSPFSDTSLVGNADYTRMYYTGGLGFRLKNFFVDAAYVRNNYKSINMVVNDQPAVDESINNSVVFTFGYTFR